MTRHVRHIFTQATKLNKKYSRHAINLLIVTFPSHPTQMGCCNTITQCLIVRTINPIWRSRPVHPGTKNFLQFVALRARDFIIFAHNYFKKQNTNQASHCFDFILCIFFLSLGLDTSKQSQSIHTLIVQTIVSVVLETFSWQPNKEPLKVSLQHFLLSSDVSDSSYIKSSLSWIVVLYTL